MNLRIFFIGAVLIIIAPWVQGQGCSDAGFCTVNSFKPNDMDANVEYNNELKLGISYGKADHSINILANYLEFRRQVNDKLGINTKLTTINQSGNGVSSFGFSDLFLSADYLLGANATITLGTKIPLSDGGKTKNNLPLPMDYQSSLGTFDLILGFGYVIKKFQLVLALQQPLTQNNNSFLSEIYQDDSELSKFQSTNNYKRSGDVLLRISYPIQLGNAFRLSLSMLPVYHLKNDRFTNINGIEQDIEGSAGLTLNANAFIDYQLNPANALQLNFGMPFITRDARPDGLTRHFIATLQYRIKF